MNNIAFAVLAVVAFAVCFVSAADINICQGVTDGIFLADNTDCSKYITCMGEKAYPGSCSDGLFFSVDTQRCDTAEKSKCAPKCTDVFEFISVKKTCNKFIMCFAGVPILDGCPDNLQYNEQTNRCDYPQNVDCVSNMCVGINDPENIHYLKSRTGCGTYYICVSGVPVRLTCAEGLYFNEKLKNCDYKENVNCTAFSKRCCSCECDRNADGSSATSNLWKCGVGLVASAKSRNVLPYSKMPPTRANISCPKHGSHFYPSPSDPGAYFFCSNGKGIVLTCSTGLVYDKSIEACRDPKNVKK